MTPELPQTEPTIHVVLVAPEIPWNTGAIGRTCLAVGARLHLVRPLGFSLDERRLRRAGLDYWSSVDLTQWNCWGDLEPELPRLGAPHFFSAEAPQTVWQADLRGPTVLVFGCETQGLPQALRQRYADHLVSLPMQPGPVRSLNLSNAVAIATYESLRQQSSGSRRD